MKHFLTENERLYLFNVEDAFPHDPNVYFRTRYQDATCWLSKGKSVLEIQQAFAMTKRAVNVHQVNALILGSQTSFQFYLHSQP